MPSLSTSVSVDDETMPEQIGGGGGATATTTDPSTPAPTPDLEEIQEALGDKDLMERSNEITRKLLVSGVSFDVVVKCVKDFQKKYLHIKSTSIEMAAAFTPEMWNATASWNDKDSSDNEEDNSDGGGAAATSAGDDSPSTPSAEEGDGGVPMHYCGHLHHAVVCRCDQNGVIHTVPGDSEEEDDALMEAFLNATITESSNGTSSDSGSEEDDDDESEDDSDDEGGEDQGRRDHDDFMRSQAERFLRDPFAFSSSVVYDSIVGMCDVCGHTGPMDYGCSECAQNDYDEQEQVD